MNQTSQMVLDWSVDLVLIPLVISFVAREELEDSGFIAQGGYDFILIKGTHQKRAHGKLKVSDKAKDYYRVGVLKSGMHTAVLKEINITCDVFLRGDIGGFRGLF